MYIRVGIIRILGNIMQNRLEMHTGSSLLLSCVFKRNAIRELELLLCTPKVLVFEIFWRRNFRYGTACPLLSGEMPANRKEDEKDRGRRKVESKVGCTDKVACWHSPAQNYVSNRPTSYPHELVCLSVS